MKAPTVNMADLVRRFTLTVTINVEKTRVFRARLWLGVRFVKLGAWIIGLGKVDVKNAQATVTDSGAET